MDDSMLLLLSVFLGVGLVVLTCFATIWRCFKNINTDTPRRNYNEGSNQGGYGADSSAGGIVAEAHKSNVPIDPYKYYTEEEAVDIAIEAKGLTILRSDSGRLWKSSMDGKTQRFLNDDTEVKKNVKTIWLKNSPCLRCAQRLNRECGPVSIYIGHVYQEQDTEREEERKREIDIMKQNGFTFLAWKKYCDKKGTNTTLRNSTISVNTNTTTATPFQRPDNQAFEISSQENLSAQQNHHIVAQHSANSNTSAVKTTATDIQRLCTSLENLSTQLLDDRSIKSISTDRITTTDCRKLEYKKHVKIDNGDTVTEEQVFKWIQQEYFDSVFIPESMGLTAHEAHRASRLANRALNDRRTLLYVADTKQVYFSDKHQHAEINFITMTSCQIIENINITNSPCYKCASKLIKYFKHCRPKPTIYIGQIWRLRNKRDNQALKAMMRQGFKFKVWNKLHDMIYPGDNTATIHLKKLKKQNYFRYYTLSQNHRSF